MLGLGTVGVGLVEHAKDGGAVGKFLVPPLTFCC
jgi:hypothetical protein